MAYSKAFREGLEDAVSKARWRMETHFKSHFRPEENPATLGDLHKSLVVMHDCLENFITEVVNYLEGEIGRLRADGRGALKAAAMSPRPRPRARVRPASGRGPAATKLRRR